MKHSAPSYWTGIGPARSAAREALQSVWALLKPRVMSLVVFTGFVGMMIAPGSLDSGLMVVAILCIAAGAGGAGALNMWYDRDIDAIMERTKNRPIPAGLVTPTTALIVGLALSSVSVLVMGLAANWVAAGLLALTIAFYILVYTIWLKHRTPQNIVIGGAAGALPPMIGWAAVTGDVSAASFSLFLIIFLWTPPHFWALALYRNDDYVRAGIPMMPVVAGRAATIRQMVGYAVALVPLSVAPTIFGIAGIGYAVIALLLALAYLAVVVDLWRIQDDVRARRAFRFSIVYLTGIFVALMIDAAIGT
ncbi:MAG: heme o synthase [Alphaproteobacteria bacterium]|nr:heme o synthase [Alphaproteobacteria bacterium]